MKSNLQLAQAEMRDRVQRRETGWPAPSQMENHAGEQHYSTSEIAQGWNLSEKTVHRLFVAQPGVLVIGGGVMTPDRKRAPRTTLRIPASVRDRVWRRLASKTGVVQ